MLSAFRTLFSRPSIKTSTLLERSLQTSASAVTETRGHTSGHTPFTWQDPFPEDTVFTPPEEVFRAGTRHHHICNTAFPIAHNKTIRPYRVQRLRDQTSIKEVLYGAYGNLDKLMLYVHVPFCHTRCQFCEYTVVNPTIGRVDDIQKVYFDALIEEFRLYDSVLDTKSKTIVGFDIGGGTPSMAHTSQIERLMTAAHQYFKLSPQDLEISIETTPKIAASEPDKIRAYYQMGMRRISMGVQTTDFSQAKQLKRDDANASTDYLYKAVENIRKAGFQSLNIDLMYGFPLRAGKPDPWPQTVADAISLEPDHITLYRMRYKGTSMAHLAHRVKLDQVNEQEGVARRILAEAGFSGMIGKNTYSRTPGSSGCSDYLDKRVVRAVPYLGYGLGAQSFSHHTLSYNLGAVTKKMDQYIRSVELGRIPIQDLYHLSRWAAIAKMASVSFYYGGIDLDAFKNCFHVNLQDLFPHEINFVIQNGLMCWENGRLQLTPTGKKYVGGVIAQFYSPAVKSHIVSLSGGETFDYDILEMLQSQRTSSKPEIEQIEARKASMCV